MTNPELAAKIQSVEEDHKGIAYAFFRPKSLTRNLIVCFGPMGKGGYSRISWFLDNADSNPDAYLFLRDPLESFYCGIETPLYNIYVEIIERAILRAGVDKGRVLTIGNSMGGTAAIFFAAMMELGAAAATNPQVDIESAAKSPWGWAHRMRRAAHPFMELNVLLPTLSRLPVIYVFLGNEEPDVAAYAKLKASLSNTNHPVHLVRLIEGGHKSEAPTRNDIDQMSELLTAPSGAREFRQR